MDINYIGIVLCAVVAMIVGVVWYGPLFGKAWLSVTGASALDIEARAQMQKTAMPLYVLQFLLTLFQVFVLSQYITGWADSPAWSHALWIWAGFIVPTVAASAMWNNDPTKLKLARFGIQAGYQLLVFMIFVLILGWF